MAADGGPGGDASSAPFTQRLHISLVSDAGEIRCALDRIMDHATTFCSDEAALGAVQIVLAEVLNNISEHAYVRRPGDGIIMITCTIAPGALRFAVLDKGREMPVAALDKGSRHRRYSAQEELPEGGFGWHLIRSLSTNLSYARRRGRNRLCFDIPMAAPRSCNKGDT
ncbi:ATP-binding protein [Sediminimonas sp.]|uniref:ATP-binding protein n=1 Tax=Sediminimonas sp. TaxID=2823379 RepID=UPI0025E8C0E8|nr:ATP-binding protein [Sediminimonas sp.]